MEKAISSITASPSRRNFIKSGSAAIAALAIPALANAAPALGQDAELIELGRQLEGVSAKWWASSEPIKRLREVAENQYPPLPDVLKARDTDKLFGLPEANDGRWYTPTKGGNRDEPGYYVTGHLNELKQFTPRRSLRTPADQHVTEYFRGNGHECPALYFKSDKTVLTTQSWPEAQARVDDLIAAIEGWRKSCKKIDHACGYMKAQREFERLATRNHALLDKISEIEAKSLEGVLVKARAVKLIHRDDDLIDLGDATDELLAASVLNELLALKS